MPYNGELKELYNDLDKRISVETESRMIWRQALKEHMDAKAKADEEHRGYMHDRMHDMLDQMALISAKIEVMPCREHINEFGWLRKAIWVVAVIGAGWVGSLTAFAVKVHLGV